MNRRPIRGRSSIAGFAIGRIGTRREWLERLRPEGGFVPLDLDLFDVVAQLDPGVIDWQANRATWATDHSG